MPYKTKERKREYNKEWRKTHIPRRDPELHQFYTQRRKRLVLTHYGNGKLVCLKCGFDDIRALSIDHLNGNGNQDRVGKKLGGTNFYAWLIKNNYPTGYQTLCMNCNWIKRSENKECG